MVVHHTIHVPPQTNTPPPNYCLHARDRGSICVPNDVVHARDRGSICVPNDVASDLHLSTECFVSTPCMTPCCGSICDNTRLQSAAQTPVGGCPAILDG